MNLVSFEGLEFGRQPVQKYRPDETAFTVYRRVGMPRIPDHRLNVAVYLYRSRAAAVAGEDAGGTGFIAGIQYPTVPTHAAIMVVTNKHVITKGADRVEKRQPAVIARNRKRVRARP